MAALRGGRPEGRPEGNAARSLFPRVSTAAPEERFASAPARDPLQARQQRGASRRQIKPGATGKRQREQASGSQNVTPSVN